MTPSPDTGFAERTIVVSGAAQGIGRRLTERLLAAGARVAALDHDDAALAHMVTALEAGDRLSTHHVDVGRSADVEAAVEAAAQQHGQLDYLACVAGILQMGRLSDLSDEQWLSTFRVNTDGVFYLSRAVARRMIAQQAGAIVVVSSNAASTPRMGMGAYCASKAATTQMMRCMGLELAEHGIRCNIVSPGSTDTDMLKGMFSHPEDRERVIKGSLATFKAGIPLNRIATCDDIVDAILYLLSDQARHITLHDLRVDGGATLGQI
ncbi:2,3-dihydro-2,3-dihydroxybenzoate dehydrogenase [Larsenimonas rhizosphaerae]|uniref:2,3-dihydro-2,3-dihydroxybenzoate dehydrogenase n=1 Tax=Larsenimonas rhizosphaerae TaxID=2944682 RepID=A0AA41ZHX9_9GAMM|nr:2,3-dihydro-2,3-dihydroxybenzoate dehydrogenase [Larsenimonas rhizosphaerae]MCX2524489.1 2,3-dihydro-2,3-dihydroxybenzoate dehydrogenase [Larsenimonas rhizosphaerae]